MVTRFFLALILSSNTLKNAPKCPVFQQQLRNFTERILTSTLCKILLPHASICTIKRKLRNFTEFCRSRFFHTQTTYGAYEWRQLSFNFHPAAFFFQKTHRLVKKSTNFTTLPSTRRASFNVFFSILILTSMSLSGT